MWPLSRSAEQESDDGAVMILVALFLVSLLGMAALVIDIGALYVEKRQLQNGADAAALAVAQDCAADACGAFSDTAGTYADLNAKDGATAVEAVCGVGPGLPACADPAPAGADGATGWVRVRTRTETTGGGNEVPFVLAPVMNAALSGKTIRASAVAAWGSPLSASIIPLTFSQCEFEAFGGVVPTSTTAGRLPSVSPATIYFHTSKEASPCPASPAGGDAPGGFGWLSVSTDRHCLAIIDAEGWVPVSAGVAPSCDPVPWRNTTVLIAIFDDTNKEPGSNLKYHVLGFAAFTITGYAFTSDFWSSNSEFKNAKNLCPLARGASGDCIQGRFTAVSRRGQSFGGPDLGVRIIKMVG